MKKMTYVTLKDLADFNKIDKELLTEFLIEKGFLVLSEMKLIPTDKGKFQGIHIAAGKYGEFLLFDKSMELYGLTKFRKFGTENKKKIGNDYEIFIGRHFEKNGYLVKYNGIENGVKDNGIDLIAINKEEILLIQCKNWSKDWVEKNNKFIEQKELRAFIGDCATFVADKEFFKKFKVRRLFITSDAIFAKDAYAFAKNSTDMESLIIKYI